MLYHLFEYLRSAGFDFPGSGLMHYISFRAITCAVLAILVSMWVGKKIIAKLQKKQIGETIRDLGLEGQLQKKGTPTMGGIIILISILIPILLFGNLANTNVQLLILTTVWLGALGFIDDYIKVFKHNKEGLNGKYKIVGQVLLGVIVGLTLYFTSEQGVSYSRTTIPFVKGNEFDYKWLIPFSGKFVRALQGGLYVVVITFIITACSNGTNLTDGMDGLAAGVSAIVGATLGVLAYLSGHVGFAEYLNIMYLPNIGEVTVYVCCFVGALLGFLWYNAFPAQVFMGDTGSLALGGIIGVLAIIIRKELLLPILCGIFFVESLSVIIQRAYFKYTKKKTGTGVRVFRMSPLHHHYQKENPDALIQKPAQIHPENKIVVRFWIVSIILAVVTIVTLKIR
ncbi:MAG: phospho-N-acetylmuramoyl-pentapeptide-transferase [Bacteroidales bacterium]|nr:phospho-N-acetylmuramoyl-pentapeptide-transferase [Bacteroidales bacterium]MBQ2598903.1 phospho-N-acetylmuramoyl-pentapeptide-transferase [Bacteroidales bacterium]